MRSGKVDAVGTGRGPAKVGARRPASPSKKNKPPTSSFRDLKPAFSSSPHFQPHRPPYSILFAGPFIDFCFFTTCKEKTSRKQRHFANCLVSERAKRTMARRSQPSTDSSPTSFYSSKEEDSELTSKSTTASTPTTGSPCQYRTARELPHELKEHCQIFLEEQLCMHTCVTPPLLPRRFPLMQSILTVVLTILVMLRHLRHQPS